MERKNKYFDKRYNLVLERKVHAHKSCDAFSVCARGKNNPR